MSTKPVVTDVMKSLRTWVAMIWATGKKKKKIAMLHFKAFVFCLEGKNMNNPTYQVYPGGLFTTYKKYVNKLVDESPS